MLYGLKASSEITGGPWYNDQQELDQEFIGVLYDAIFRWLRLRDYASESQVANFVRNTGISKEELEDSHVEQLLNTMVYDDIVERIVPPEGLADDAEARNPLRATKVVYYRVKKRAPNQDKSMHIPCTVCPYVQECLPGSLISPSSCVYMERWLGF
mmetsp:Transcript_11944/g.24328  ORF Transcript_11944/g.24328 Transcript_11944/m.24328 type:complete len:156 (+) Transcript_11944:37-504(+)